MFYVLCFEQKLNKKEDKHQLSTNNNYNYNNK